MYIEDTLRDVIRALARIENALARQERPASTPAVEPTYISSQGKALRLRDMPTRYLQNVANAGDHRIVLGLREAVEAELSRRSDRDETLR